MSSSNSSSVPSAAEIAQILFAERCWLQGSFVSSAAYGITVSLYLSCLHLLFRKKNQIELKKWLPLLIYASVSFILSTIFMISLAAFTQMAFIDDHYYAGGPIWFEINMFLLPIDKAGSAAFVLSNWLANALLVWRFKVVYQECRVPIWIVIILPCLMLAGSVAMGMMFLIEMWTKNPYLTKGISFTLPYLSLSLALNIMLAIAIALRLLAMRYRIVSMLGPNDGTRYPSVAAIAIESASLYAGVSITFLVLFLIENAISEVYMQSLSQFQTISALLIVFRVTQGEGWTTRRETAARAVSTWKRESQRLELSKMQYAPESPRPSVTKAGSVDGTVETVRWDAA